VKNTFSEFRCKRCGGVISVWARLPPGETHAYRVTCKACGKFVGWGTEPQHQLMLHAHEKLETVNATPEPPSASLSEYL
jgi:hypothetical protein